MTVHRARVAVCDVVECDTALVLGRTRDFLQDLDHLGEQGWALPSERDREGNPIVYCPAHQVADAPTSSFGPLSRDALTYRPDLVHVVQADLAANMAANMGVVLAPDSSPA